MCGTSLAGCPQYLAHDGYGHEPLVFITFPVGSSLAASLAVHLSCLKGYLFVSSFSASQSTRVWDVSWSVSILCRRAIRGILKIALSIESLSLVENLCPISEFLFPSGAVGTLVKSLYFSSWMLWYWSFGNPTFWSSLNFCFAAVSHSTFSAAHLSRGPV